MKIAFTGTHGTGKTTSVFQLAYNLKMLHSDKRITTLTEVASESPFPLNKKTTTESQNWIYVSQLQREIMLQSKYDIVVCDRTICDAIAYSVRAGFGDLAKAMMEFSRYHVQTYDDIRFKTIKNNSFNADDGLREHGDLEFRKDIEDILLGIYKDLNVNVTFI